MTLSLTDMAVTRAEADAYATARGRAAWTGSDTLKDQALRRGQDYIAGVYNARWIDTWENAAAPTAVKYAIIEAAIREITTAGSLTPDIILGREKVLTKVGSLGWTPLKDEATAADLRPVLTVIDGLLAGLITTYRGPFVA